MTGPSDKKFPVARSPEEWHALLTREQFQVLREHGTEPAGASPLNREHREGLFVCAGCGAELFASEAKYDSGSGWPSFSGALAEAVGSGIDNSHSMTRTEIYCRRCGGHLGHVFEDGPQPTGLRFCTNGAALRFLANNEDS